MPPVIFAPAALRDLQRLREFLRPKSQQVAQRAATTIQLSLRQLAAQPSMGRPIKGLPEAFREWVIPFGDSGYLGYPAAFMRWISSHSAQLVRLVPVGLPPPLDTLPPFAPRCACTWLNPAGVKCRHTQRAMLLAVALISLGGNGPPCSNPKALALPQAACTAFAQASYPLGSQYPLTAP